jgi:hypothetical protein
MVLVVRWWVQGKWEVKGAGRNKKRRGERKEVWYEFDIAKYVFGLYCKVKCKAKHSILLELQHTTFSTSLTIPKNRNWCYFQFAVVYFIDRQTHWELATVVKDVKKRLLNDVHTERGVVHWMTFTLNVELCKKYYVMHLNAGNTSLLENQVSVYKWNQL